jgi:D-alanyl-D-alanine carboxypeptidase (penicillin-binding protein 5/6)
VALGSPRRFILAEQNGKDKRQVGSLTKIATACVVLDWAEHKQGDLNRVVTVPPEAFVGTGENNVGLQPGDQIALRDLLYAALVQSDNIAAFTLAYHVGSELQSSLGAAPKGGPVEVFVAQMNALAATLKMQRTRFLNPHGIDDRAQPYSTALDMARLTRYAMNKAAFRFYVSQRERQISWMSAGKKRAYLLKNTNELLGQNGIDGVKTGRTARAGDCLILSSNRQAEVRQEGRATLVTPRHLIVVVLGSTDRFGEGSALLAQGWQLYDQWAANGRQVQPSKTL